MVASSMEDRWFDLWSRRVWRYQSGNQNPYIEEEDNTMAKRKSTKGQTTIYKTYIYNKDRVTQTPLKAGDELRCSGSQSRLLEILVFVDSALNTTHSIKKKEPIGP